MEYKVDATSKWSLNLDKILDLYNAKKTMDHKDSLHLSLI
jgi:hypothetical protein